MLLEEEEKDKRLKLHALLMWRSACFYGAGGPKSNEQKKKKKNPSKFFVFFFSPQFSSLYRKQHCQNRWNIFPTVKWEP